MNKKNAVFCYFWSLRGCFWSSGEWPVAKQISLESCVFSSILHESGINFRLKRAIFNELSLVFALLELPGAAFWSSGGIARLGMNGLCGILAISHLGMNRSSGKWPILVPRTFFIGNSYALVRFINFA